MLIQQATLEDVQGVLDLLKANHVSHVSDKTDGFVTTNMTEKQLVTLITKENGVTIAKENEKILLLLWPHHGSFGRNGRSLSI